MTVGHLEVHRRKKCTAERGTSVARAVPSIVNRPQQNGCFGTDKLYGQEAYTLNKEIEGCNACIMFLFNPRRHKVKNVTRRHGGGGIGPLPSTFHTIHPID